jgi:membrane protein implicated in regulation of membrane protease activity
MSVPVIAFLTSWANSPFAVAIGAVGVFALLQVTGLLGLVAGGGESAHDADHDVDHDVEHDAEGDHDADGDHDGDANDRSLAAAALGAMGVGTIPLSMLWQSFALAFAASGFAMNLHYIARPGGPPLYTLAWTAPAAFAGGCLAVTTLTKWLGPVLSSKDQEATSRTQLIGQIGVVISSKVDHEFGEVRIRDRSGHDLRVVCKLAREAKGAPAEHQSVVVVDCDDKGGLFVEPLNEDDETEGGTRRA